MIQVAQIDELTFQVSFGESLIDKLAEFGDGGPLEHALLSILEAGLSDWDLPSVIEHDLDDDVPF